MSKITSKIPAGIQPLSPKSLRSGMKAHLSYPKWDRDFHANFYCGLRAEIQTHGFTEEWWKERVDNLSRWIAIRPLSKDEISKRGAPRLVELKREYNRIIAHDKNANIASCDWDVAAGLFKVAAKIKPVPSPVFASKLCHFILPALFPIFDRESLQSSGESLQLNPDPTAEDYQKYWECCRALWIECDCKQELKEILRTKIKAADGNVTHYPWESRISELSLMNSKTS